MLIFKIKKGKLMPFYYHLKNGRLHNFSPLQVPIFAFTGT